MIGQRLRTSASGLGADFEMPTLVLLAIVAGGACGFISLAGEVIAGDTRAFDEALLLSLRTTDPADPIGPVWFEEAVRDCTALGSAAVLLLLSFITIGILCLQGKHRPAALIAAAIAGGIVLSTLLKLGFDRPRPELVPHGMVVYTHSFPSSHSMMSATTYLTMGALLARVQPRRRQKIFTFTVALLLTILVGMSRVYLGVHWPTDVLAGWAAGATWAALCWLTAKWLPGPESARH